MVVPFPGVGEIVRNGHTRKATHTEFDPTGSVILSTHPSGLSGMRGKPTMRTITATLAFALSFASAAQPIERVEVVQVDSANAAELYLRAERWFVDAFKDADEVVQLRDSTSKTIVGKGSKLLGWLIGKGITMSYGNMTFLYTLEVSTKDGRYRARVYDAFIESVPYTFDTACYIIGQATEGSKRQQKILANAMTIRRQVCDQSSQEVQALLATLKAAMLKHKEEW